MVWGRTQKRDRWGQRRNLARAERDWIRVERPELCIVSEELWCARRPIVISQIGAS
jgi:hypothetical protein